MLIVDAHEDLAYNMVQFGRDYTRSAEETRRLEQGTETPLRNGDALLGWPDYHRGRVAVVFGTLFATPAHAQRHNWDTTVYATAFQAHDLYRRQVDAYHRLVSDHPNLFRLIEAKRHLEEVVALWRAEAEKPPKLQEPADPDEPQPRPEEREEPAGPPVGLVILMEGAEGVREPAELELWWKLGVRLIGPAWSGTRFCGGTHQPGPLTSEGYTLLEAMSDFGFALDISHMDEEAVLQALDVYPRPVIASHGNALRLLQRPGVEIATNRHLSDRVIRGLLERDGVIGVVPFNRFLLYGWKNEDGRALVTLSHVASQIDYICQMAGDARHVGIGSDFEGGFGLQSVPAGIDTVADLQKLAPLLAEKGYSDQDISAILGENWLNLLRKILPEEQ